MGRLKLSQDEIDKLVVVDRIMAEPTVRGVGVVDVPFSVKVGGKHIWQYRVWYNMLIRCFDEKYKLRKPTYSAVTCANDWLSFGNFLEWCNKETGFFGRKDGFELDKDIIKRGNTIYSQEHCAFVPSVVNSLLTDHRGKRGDNPVGVHFHKRDGVFNASLTRFGSVKHLGAFSSAEDAFQAYKIAKEAHIKVIALQHKASLKPAVFESLMNWEILSDG